MSGDSTAMNATNRRIAATIVQSLLADPGNTHSWLPAYAAEIDRGNPYMVLDWMNRVCGVDDVVGDDGLLVANDD